MTWFKVDDDIADHPKVRRLGKDRLPAMGMWTLLGSWAGRYNTEGFVPDEIVERYDPKHKLARKLVEVGLWEVTEQSGERGYQYHDWFDIQPSVAEIEKKKAKNRERQRRFRLRRAGMSPDDDPGSGSEASDDELILDGDDEECSRVTPVSGNAPRNALREGGPPPEVGNESATLDKKDVRTGSKNLENDPSNQRQSTLVDAGDTTAEVHRPAPEAEVNEPRNALHNAHVMAPRPDPTRSTSSGHQGGERPGSNTRATTTPPTPHDPPCEKPCRRCRDARLAVESTTADAAAAEREQRAAAARRARECSLCDEHSWVIGPDGRPVEPARRCQHRSLRSVS